MADIELVIKVPEEIYKASQIIDVKHEDVIQIPLETIANGTPLPKGHGRIRMMNENILNEKTLTIVLPHWARIGVWVLIKDVQRIRGDDSNHWYTEKIVGFGYDGVFHQACNCPVYYTKFSEYGKTIKLKENKE